MESKAPISCSLKSFEHLNISGSITCSRGFKVNGPDGSAYRLTIILNGPHTVFRRARGVVLRRRQRHGSMWSNVSAFLFCRSINKNGFAAGTAWFRITSCGLMLQFIQIAAFIAHHHVIGMSLGFSQQVPGKKIVFGSAFRASFGFSPK